LGRKRSVPTPRIRHPDTEKVTSMALPVNTIQKQRGGGGVQVGKGKGDLETRPRFDTLGLGTSSVERERPRWGISINPKKNVYVNKPTMCLVLDRFAAQQV